MNPRPNIVVVVLDCVRARSFAGGSDPVTGMPAVEALVSAGVRFPRAIAPSPWTLPSHASILTGLEPWQHNLHLRGQAALNPELKTLPSTLGAVGYRTLLLSGNALLSSETGFSQQFQASGTADWWEPFLRHTDYVPEVANGSSAHHDHVSRFGVFRRLFVELMLRYPAFPDVLNQVSSHVLDPGGHDGGVAPWIEPTLHAWLEKQPADQPIFSMINLIDAHDPYLWEPEHSEGFREWWRHVSVPQQYAAYRFSGIAATPQRAAVLNTLYRQSIHSLDRRIARIVQILRDAHRWENTLFVLTSDHGQALLEKGHLFHGQRVDEPIIRVPLTVRFPQDQFAGAVANGWASLVDIAPLAYRLAGVSPSQSLSGIDLQKLIDGARPAPAVAIADGIVGGRTAAAWVPPSELPRLYNVMAAIYAGDWKVVVEKRDPTVRAYDLAADPEESVDRWPTAGASLESEATLGRWVMSRIDSAHQSLPEPGVIRRLEGWGYI